MNRESFLGRLRESLAEGGAVPVPPPERYRPPAAPLRRELVERLARELEAVGGQIHRVSSSEEARRRVVEILEELQVKKLLRGDTPGLRDLAVDADLAAAGIEVTVASLTDDGERDELRAAAFAADAGLTSVDFGVAETGTLALVAGPGQGRAVSLLPPVHVAVLKAEDVVYELAALVERLGEPPSALTLITGPSRTGDIELKLTVGVHGPKELVLVLIG